jgi:hypothetical protein
MPTPAPARPAARGARRRMAAASPQRRRALGLGFLRRPPTGRQLVLCAAAACHDPGAQQDAHSSPGSAGQGQRADSTRMAQQAQAGTCRLAPRWAAGVRIYAIVTLEKQLLNMIENLV